MQVIQMNLKQAKRLRKLVKLMDCASIKTVYTYAAHGANKNISKIVLPDCRRGLYLAAKKKLKGHNFNLIQFDGICL
jgi:hypothetical protein